MKSLSLFLGLSGILVPEKQRLMFVASNFLSGKCGVALAFRGDPFADWLAGNLPEFRPAIRQGFSSGPDNHIILPLEKLFVVSRILEMAYENYFIILMPFRDLPRQPARDGCPPASPCGSHGGQAPPLPAMRNTTLPRKKI